MPNTEQTETPLTDMNAFTTRFSCGEWVVSADFARQLERELDHRKRGESVMIRNASDWKARADTLESALRELVAVRELALLVSIYRVTDNPRAYELALEFAEREPIALQTARDLLEWKK